MKRTVLRGLVLTLAGTASVAGVSLLRNVLIARVMGPAIFGLWNLCLVAMRLAQESHLGALSSVAVESPRHRGAAEEDRALALERRAGALTTVLGLAAGLVAAVVLRLVGGPDLAKAAVLLAVVILLQQRFFASTTALRARKRFGSIALMQLGFAGVYLVGLLLLLPDYFLTGALLAGAVGFVVAILLARRADPDALDPPRPALLRRLRPMLVRGFPVYVVHVTFVVMLQADRVIVGTFLGREALGHYGVLVIGGTALLFLPDAFSGVLWPFAGESFGRSRMDPEALRNLTRGAVVKLAFMLVGLLPATLAAVDALVAHVLPMFAPALPALRVYGAGMFLLALALPVRNVAMTVGAAVTLLRVQGMALTVLIALQGTAAATGLGLTGVAFGGTVGWGILLGGSLGVLRSAGVLRWRDALRLVGSMLGLLALSLLLDAGITRFAPAVATATGAAVRIGVPLLLAGVVGVLLVRSRAE